MITLQTDSSSSIPSCSSWCSLELSSSPTVFWYPITHTMPFYQGMLLHATCPSQFPHTRRQFLKYRRSIRIGGLITFTSQPRKQGRVQRCITRTVCVLWFCICAPNMTSTTQCVCGLCNRFHRLAFLCVQLPRIMKIKNRCKWDWSIS